MMSNVAYTIYSRSGKVWLTITAGCANTKWVSLVMSNADGKSMVVDLAPEGLDELIKTLQLLDRWLAIAKVYAEA